ncbi:hypothetical protein KEM48_002565 [Puccinia striiformis f. sp. tritici PST-130]|nr:hypothetical protein KEM48_002565 [Puccinia striiformis f. sp. tritici PST-130]
MAFFQKRGLSAASRLIQHHPTIQPFSRSILSSLPQTNKPNSNNFLQRWFSCSKLRSSDHQVNRLSIFQQTKSQNNYKQIFIASAGLVGSVVLLDGFLNRDQRVEPLSQAQKELLNSSFQHTGIGLAITSVLARYMFKNGLTMRMMAMNPLAVAGLGLYGFWLAFTACQAATLSPLYFYAPAILSRAALYTVGVVGSLSYVGATAKNDKFLYLGGPLLAGVSVVALSSLAPLVLPVTAARTLMLTESISLYGGLAVFSGFVLYDTQKILNHGLLVQQGRMKPDPVNESVGLIMDSINIFIRMVQILSMQSNRK